MCDHGFYDYDHSDIYDYYHSDLRLLYRAPHDHGQYYIGTANGLQDSTRIREFRPIRSPELIKKLFDMGLRPNYADMAKRGVIHKEVFEHTSWKERNTSAMWALLLHTVENGSIEDVIFLLDNQCDTGYVNKKEKAQVTHTALLVALHIMDVEKIKFLLAHIKANVKTAAARPAYENLVTLEESDVHYAAYSEKRKELKVTSFDTMLQAIQKMILDLVKSHSLVEGKSPSVYGELLTAYLKDSRKDDLSISSLTTLRKALKEKGCATHAEWIVLIDQRTAELNAASPATLLTHARKDWQKSQNEGVAESSAQGAGVAARPRSMSWSS